MPSAPILIHTASATTNQTVVLSNANAPIGSSRFSSYLVDCTAIGSGSGWSVAALWSDNDGNNFTLGTKTGVTTTGISVLSPASAFTIAAEDLGKPFPIKVQHTANTAGTTTSISYSLYLVPGD